MAKSIIHKKQWICKTFYSTRNVHMLGNGVCNMHDTVSAKERLSTPFQYKLLKLKNKISLILRGK